MQKTFYALAALLVSLGTTGCATLFTGTSDNITVDSEPEGARILIDGIDYGRTPTTVTVRRAGLGDRQIVLQLEGYEDRVFTLQKEFNVVSLLNLAGVLGWAVDVATGAVMKYSPRHYDMTLHPERLSFRMQDLPRDPRGHYLLPATEETFTVKDEASGLTIVFDR